MRAKDLRPATTNPRVITDDRLDQLGKSLDHYGDISGITFNRKSGNLVTGHQRNRKFDKTTKVVITKRFPKPTEKGTVAVGYLLHKGERFNYREVEWNDATEEGARTAANNSAGDWEPKQLKINLKKLASFDVDFDLSLTMLKPEELEGFHLGMDELESVPKQKKKVVGVTRVEHECPRCGCTFNSSGGVIALKELPKKPKTIVRKKKPVLTFDSLVAR